MILDQMTALVVGLAVVLGIGGIIWYSRTKHPDMTIGDLINLAIVREKVSVFVFMNILINIAEGMAAAGIHPPGEEDVIFVARLFVHFAISFVAITSNIMAPIMISMAWGIRKDKNKRGRLAVMLFLITMLLIGALGLPFLNLLIIAGGLGHTDTLMWFIKYFDTSAWEAMPYILKATIGATFVHYLLATTDASWVMLNPSAAMSEAISKSLEDLGGKKSSGKKKDKKSSVDKNKEKKDEQDIKNVEDSILFTLRRYGYKGNKLTNMVRECNKVFDNMDERRRTDVANRLAKIVSDIQSWDNSDLKKNATDAEKEQKNNQFKDRIASLYEASENGKQGKTGFGKPLKQRKGN